MSFYLTSSSLILSFVIHAVLTVRLDSDSKQLMGGCFNETRPLNCSDYGYPGYSVVDTSEPNKWCCVSFDDDEDFETITATSQAENTVAETTAQFQSRDFNNLAAISNFEASRETVAVPTLTTIAEISVGSYIVLTSESSQENEEISENPLQAEEKTNLEDFESEKQRENLTDIQQTIQILSGTTLDSENSWQTQRENLSNDENAEETSADSSRSFSAPATGISSDVDISSTSTSTANEKQSLLVIAPVDSNFNGALELVEDSDLTEAPYSTAEEVTTTASETTGIKITEADIQAQTETTISILSTADDEEQFEATRKTRKSDESSTSPGEVIDTSSYDFSSQNSENNFDIPTVSSTSGSSSSLTDDEENTSKIDNLRFKAENLAPEDTNEAPQTTNQIPSTNPNPTEENTNDVVTIELKPETPEATSGEISDEEPSNTLTAQDTTLETVSTSSDEASKSLFPTSQNERKKNSGPPVTDSSSFESPEFLEKDSSTSTDDELSTLSAFEASDESLIEKSSTESPTSQNEKVDFVGQQATENSLSESTALPEVDSNLSSYNEVTATFNDFETLKPSIETPSTESLTSPTENESLIDQAAMDGPLSLSELPEIDSTWSANNEASTLASAFFEVTQADPLETEVLSSSSSEIAENSPSTFMQQKHILNQEEKESEEVAANETQTTASSNLIEDKITQVLTQEATLVYESTKETEGGVTENPEELETKPPNSTVILNANNSEPLEAEESPPEDNDAANEATTDVTTAENMIHLRVGKVKANVL